MFKRLFSTAKNVLKNSQISAKSIYLISKNGVPLGLRNLISCLKTVEKGFELVQVAPSSPLGSDIPIVKEFKIESPSQKTQEKLVKPLKPAKSLVKKKVIEMLSCIDDHDKGIKLNKIIGYLEKGLQVRLVISRKKSRQQQRPVSDLYKNILQDLHQYKAKAEIEETSRIEVVFSPKNK